MNVTLSGVLRDPYNNNLANATIVFETEKTSNQTLKSTSAKVNTDNVGAYSITVPYGTYTIKVKQSNNNTYHTIATGIRVNDSSTATTLNQLITEAVDIDDVPDLILQIESLKQDIVDLRDENVLIRNETQQLRDEVIGIEIELQGSVDTIQTYETRLSDLENNALSIDPALSPVDGEVLVYNSTLGYFESTNYNPVTSINDLSDVNVTNPEDGQVLVFDNGVLVNTESPSGWDVKETVTINTGIVTFDLSSAKGFYVDLTEDITTINFINADTEDFVVFSIVFKQDSVGGRTISYPSNVIGPLFQPYNAPDSVSIMSFMSYDGGVSIYQSDITLDSDINGLVTIGQVDGLQTFINDTNGEITNIGTRLSAVEGSTTQVSMSTLDDVDITGISTGQILEYDGNNFVPVDQPNIPSTFAEQFNDLSDVNVTGISSGDFIYFNGSVFTGVQVDIPTHLNDLTDVVVSAPQHDQALAWNSVTQRFENRTISGSGSATNLAGLNDTNISSPQNNQLLRYDSGIGKWANWTMPAYATNLNGLSDVTITSVQNNHVLKRTSSGWINAAININDVNNLQSTLNSKANTSHTHVISDIDGLLSSLSSKADVTHTHSIADVTGLQTELNNKTTQSYVDQEIVTVTNLLGDKADTVHTHVIADVTGLQTELDNLSNSISNKADSSHTHVVADITDIVVTTPSTGQILKYDTNQWVNGGIAVADVTGLDDELLAKADTVHSHAITDISDLSNQLDAKADTVHSHGISDVTGLQDALDTKADATHTHVINDIIDFDVESPLEGHVLVFDTVDSKWVNSPALDDKADVTHTHDISDVTNLQTALDSKADTGHGHVIADVTNLQATLDGKADTSHTHVIADITDIDVSTVQDGDVLIYDSVSETFITAPNSGGGSSSLSDLSDVDTTGLVTSNILKFDGNDWLPSSVSYNELTDRPTLFSGSYNDLTDKPTIPSTLSDLSDSNIVTPQNNQFLKYDSNSSTWVNSSIDTSDINGYVTTDYDDKNEIDTITNNTVTLDVSKPTSFVITLDSDITTMNITNIPSNKFVVFSIVLKQDATGGRTVTWPVEFVNTPTISTDPNSINIITITTFDGGSTIHTYGVGI